MMTMIHVNKDDEDAVLVVVLPGTPLESHLLLHLDFPSTRDILY